MFDSHLLLQCSPAGQRGQGIQLLWRGTSDDLQPMPAGTDSSLLSLCVQGRGLALVSFGAALAS